MFCSWLRIIKNQKRCRVVFIFWFGMFLSVHVFLPDLGFLVWVRLIEWRGLDKNFVLIGFWSTLWSFLKLNFCSNCICFCFFLHARQCRLWSFSAVGVASFFSDVWTFCLHFPYTFLSLKSKQTSGMSWISMMLLNFRLHSTWIVWWLGTYALHYRVHCTFWNYFSNSVDFALESLIFFFSDVDLQVAVTWKEPFRRVRPTLHCDRWLFFFLLYGGLETTHCSIEGRVCLDNGFATVMILLWNHRLFFSTTLICK